MEYNWHKPQPVDEKVIKEIDDKITFLNQSTALTPIHTPIPTKNTYPTPDEFINFYNDFTFFKTPLNFSIKVGLTRLNLDKSASAYRKLVKMEYTMQKTSTDIENGVSNA
jgi:hypothetical protein